VAPILLDLADFHGEPDPSRVDRLRRMRDGGGADWLFVGRLAPNKAQHDVIAAFSVYVRHIDGRARLHLVGGSSSHRYETALHDLVIELGLTDRVHFAASVSHEELLAHYATADVFVCLSDHEGFCVPVVEAMESGVPVVAFRSSALPETVGNGGLLLPTKEPDVVAAAVERVINDAVVRARLLAAGRRRAGELSIEHTKAAFLDPIVDLVGAS
jgi:glycosyltransferase involved in cell wall biosynthesis